MSAVSYFLDKPTSRWRRFRLWLWVTSLDVRDWFLRWIYAQHNARVIIDFEDRMVSIVYAASGGMMSKPYYSKEAMLQCASEFEDATYERGYEDAKRDFGLDNEKEQGTK